MTAAEALAVAAKIEATPGCEIAGWLSPASGGSPITGCRVAYRRKVFGWLTVSRRVWIHGSQEWKPLARQLWAWWGPLPAQVEEH